MPTANSRNDGTSETSFNRAILIGTFRPPAANSVEANWQKAISDYNPRRLSEEMSIAETQTLSSTEKDVFPCLPVSENNCRDLQHLFHMEVWTTRTSQHCTAALPGEWNDMKRTLGQFVFHCVYLRHIRIDKVCDPCAVFHLFSFTDAVDSFIRHYTFCSVMPCGSQVQLVQKLQDLLPAAEMAIDFQGESSDFSETYCGNLGLSASNIRHVIDQTIKMLTAAVPHHRINYLQHQQFLEMRGTLESKCKALMAQFHSTDAVSANMLRTWLYTFLSLLVISTPNFDLSVFTFLCSPPGDITRGWTDLYRTGRSFLFLLPISPLSSCPDLFGIPFHSRVLPLLLFHLQTYLPIVHKRREPPMLPHQRNFIFPSPNRFGLCTQVEIMSIVLKFISSYNRDYTVVTLPQLRASYAVHLLSPVAAGSTLTESEKHSVYSVLANVFQKTPRRVKQLANFISGSSEREAVWLTLCALGMND